MALLRGETSQGNSGGGGHVAKYPSISSHWISHFPGLHGAAVAAVPLISFLCPCCCHTVQNKQCLVYSTYTQQLFSIKVMYKIEPRVRSEHAIIMIGNIASCISIISPPTSKTDVSINTLIINTLRRIMLKDWGGGGWTTHSSHIKRKEGRWGEESSWIQ